MTFRQRMVEIMRLRPVTTREMADLLGIHERAVLEHLEHVIRSQQVTIEPARCRNCEFLFKDRRRLSNPSRCPKCKNEWIERPRFYVA